MLQMLRWEDRLFKFKGRTALLQYLVKTGSRWATVCLGLVDELPIVRKETKTVISGHIPKQTLVGKLQTLSHASMSEPMSESGPMSESEPELLHLLRAYLLTVQPGINTSPHLMQHCSSIPWLAAQKVTVGTGIVANFPTHNDHQKYRTEFARCVPDWRGDGPRYDYILFQGEPGASGANRSYFHETGLKPAQLICVFTFIDKIPDGYKDNGRPSFRKIGHELALVEFLTIMNAGMPNPNSGMIEVRKQSEILGGGATIKRRVISVSRIRRALHLIAAESGTTGRHFINNYIDLEMYNTVY